MKRHLLGLLILLAVGTPGQADTLVYFGEPGAGSSPRFLFNFDTTTGISTTRAIVPGTDRFFGLDIRPADQKLFGVSLGDFSLGVTGKLFTIDMNTGTPTVIGDTGALQPVGLAFQPTTNALFGLDNSGFLYSVNQTTGLFTAIGHGAETRGLSFSPTGQLFGFDNVGALYNVDPATGKSTLVGSGGPSIALIAEDSTFTSSGDLFLADFGGDIFQVNPATGFRTLVGNSSDNVLGLFAVPAPASVPEPCTLVLVACGAGALACRSLARRVRRPLFRHCPRFLLK